MLAAVLLAACTREPPPPTPPVGEELPIAHVDTIGTLRCDDDESLPLFARSFGLSGGATAVALEITPAVGDRLAYALDEIDYYEWEGHYPLAFATDCADAASAAYFMRWTRWDGEPDVVEALILGSGGDTGA